MKQLLTLLIGIFLTASIYADCSASGLSVFPNGDEVKPNSIFVLNGYSLSQNIILKLNNGHDIYLESSTLKVRLLVTEICIGQYNLIQAILKPEIELEVGLEYTMHIDSLPEDEIFYKYNRTKQKIELPSYKVIAGNDTVKPQLKSKPKVIKKSLIYYGCGPSTYVVFDNPAKDDSEIIVKTTVKSLKTGIESTYYIQPDGDEIYVGHDFCASAFEFFDGKKYEVEFSFMDASGNLNGWTGKRIKFTKPTKESDKDDE